MPLQIVLASSSPIRSQLLTNADINHESISPQIDEESVKMSMLSEKFLHREIPDALADMKARKVNLKRPRNYVLGCDQVLSFEGKLYSKPKSKLDLEKQLQEMSGKTHKLISAAVIYKDMKPKWRHVNSAKLSMRVLSDYDVKKYVDRNWESVNYCTGGYEIDRKGAHLFEKIEGDFFSILGMPLLEIIGFLKIRGILDT